ncbi:MAG: 2-amino-4-hydroxy-6-hydroxymethyldihydropteridine diphosphokinase [Dehalococcoidales bacterium]|nr:2-amino-4-hydroxy-6-hydroxymethyldihydropteridine diphosphokinase [Dehalococcoidales bacterium]
MKVYLGLGSNMGDRIENLRRAVSLLSGKVEVNRVSTVYDTAPVGNTKQSRFLNLACEVTTSLAPLELLTLLKGIEAGMGRKPGPVNGPRLIDIDILLYDDRVIDTPKLAVPHPRLEERAFVLVPLSDIAPELVHPVHGKSIKQLLGILRVKPGEVVRYSKI